MGGGKAGFLFIYCFIHTIYALTAATGLSYTNILHDTHSIVAENFGAYHRVYEDATGSRAVRY